MIGQMEGCLDLGKSILLGFEADLYCSMKNAEEYVTEGKLKSENGDYEGAIADFTSAIEINPEEQLVYFWRGTAKFRLGDYNGAIADYSKDIEIGVEPYTSDSYYGRALAKNQLVDYSSAIDDMNMAIEIYDTPPYFHEFRGFLKIQAGQNESGCVDLAKAVELGSTTADKLIQEYCK
jgi:tetratricopeptide (TPR) repeat protein